MGINEWFDLFQTGELTTETMEIITKLPQEGNPTWSLAKVVGCSAMSVYIYILK